MKISVIVPCYNEEDVISETYIRLQNVMQSMEHEYEIIFVNDGSRDNTLILLKDIANTDKRVRVISFSRNFGHQPAVTAGINLCEGDIAIIIDADLQDPPELFPEMIDLYLEKGCNVVYGVRKERKGETFFKRFTAKRYYRLINTLSDVPLPKDTGDFRLIDKKVISEFNSLKEKNKYIRGLISWIGFHQEPFFYTRNARVSGISKYPLRKMLKFALTGLLYFTKKPLKLAMQMGLLCVFIGLALSLYSLYQKIFNSFEVTKGWTSTVIIVIFFGGVQLLSIGILGEYIGNMFDEIKNRPEYIIDFKLNFNEKNDTVTQQ